MWFTEISNDMFGVCDILSKRLCGEVKDYILYALQYYDSNRSNFNRTILSSPQKKQPVAVKSCVTYSQREVISIFFYLRWLKFRIFDIKELFHKRSFHVIELQIIPHRFCIEMTPKTTTALYGSIFIPK